jgi:hypothetical protein
VFGILAARFAVFQTAMRLNPNNATTVTMACLALHNFLISKKDAAYVPSTFVDHEDNVTHTTVPGVWREQANTFTSINRVTGNRSADDAQWVRNELKEYVNLEGRLPWQDKLVFGRDFSSLE